jgi:hypothetical protein
MPPERLQWHEPAAYRRGPELWTGSWLTSSGPWTSGAGPQILRDRSLDQGLERLSIEHLSLPDVDGATRVSLEAGVEEPPRVLQGGTTGEGQLDHLIVGLSRADDSSVGPYGHAQWVAGLDPFALSMMSGSASWMRRRTSARVSARQPPRDRIRSSMRREAAFSFARFASAPGLALAAAFGGDLDLAAGLRGLLARDVPLALGFALLSFIIRPFFDFSTQCCEKSKCYPAAISCASAAPRRRRRSRIRPWQRTRLSSAAESVIPVSTISRKNVSPPAMRRRRSVSERTIKSIGNGTPNWIRIFPAAVSGDIDQRFLVIGRSTSESTVGLPYA